MVTTDWHGKVTQRYPLFQPLMQMRSPTKCVISLNRLFQMQWVNWIEPKSLPQKKIQPNCGNGQNECMVHFGLYEDAMHTDSKSLFHTRISPLLNLHRLLPKQVVQDIEQLDIPFNSKEGFIRQVLGWREFMYQIHEYTDGLRRIPNKDGTWTEHPTVQIETDIPEQDGGTLINVLGYQTPLPDAFWGKKCGLNCLDSVVKDVMDDGFTHHIPRLMVLANIATLLEIKPREITDWFWVSFIDAFDWVVEPNVLAMGTFATGEVLSTKPYIAGAGYINKMSNFCKGCTFNPKKNCPLTRLYWAYLDKHRERFKDNFPNENGTSITRQTLRCQNANGSCHLRLDAANIGERGSLESSEYAN